MKAARAAPKASSAGAEPEGENTAEQIVAVARNLFLERGYEGVSMHAIARAVGITAPALYYHFTAKDEICLAFLRSLATSLLSAIEAVPQSGTPAVRLCGFVRAHVQHQFRHFDAEANFAISYSYGHFRSKLSAEQQKILDALHDRILGVLRAIVDDGLADGSFTVPDLVFSTFSIFGLGEFLPSWFKPAGRISVAQASDYCATFALRMVGLSGSEVADGAEERGQ